MSQCHNHTCYRDSETGDIWCPAFGGWQIACPMANDANESDNDNERNDDDE